jgi:hypothetical protein
MTDAQIKLIIDSILNGAIIYNWKLYLVIFLVSLVSAAITALVKGYFYERAKFKAINDSLSTVESHVLTQEKAKYQAIEDSLETIQKQIKVTTETSEKIKTALDHDNWRKKELETLKRNKIEEYYSHILHLHGSLQDKMESIFFNKENEQDPMIFDKASLIQALYLPELESEHNKLSLIVSEFNIWVSVVRSELAKEMKRTGVRPQVSDEQVEPHDMLTSRYLKQSHVILRSIKELSKELNQ